MIIDTLLAGIRRRYEELKEEMDDVCKERLAGSLFDAQMDWLNDIIENTNTWEEDTNLDLAAALLVKEELVIANSK